MRRYITITAVGLVAAVLALPALANNGKGGGNSSPSTDTSSIALNSDATFGNPLTFTVVDPPVKGYPEMSVSCFDADGNYLYLEVQMLSGSSPYLPTFSLWSSTWAAAGGGAADCTASLFYYTWKGHTETGVVYLATKTFPASAA